MPILTEEDRISHRVIFMIAVVVLLALPVTALRLFAALVVLCYLPAAPFAARTGLPLLSTVALTVTISPLMITLPVLGVMLLGLPVETAVWAIVGIAMAQFLVYGTQGAFSPAASHRRLILAFVAILAVAAFLTLWLPATNSWWRFREDSWFHAAVFHRISNHGLPVVDPYFSPLRLQYMYFYHIVLLTVSTLTGLKPFSAMIFTNFIALVGCILGFAFLAGLFTRRAVVRAAGTVLCLFGMNGLFYLFFPIRLARAFLGESTGTEILRHFFTLSPLGHETAARFLSIEGNQHLFLDKFMLGTAFSLTLGLVCVVLGLMAMRQGGRWNWILSFFYTAALCGVLFIHLVVGATALLAIAGTIVFIAFTGPRGRMRRGEFSVGLQAVLTLLAAGIALPYITSVLPGNGVGGSASFGLQKGQIIGVFSCMLPALIPAIWYLMRSEDPVATDRGLNATGVLTVWAAFVLVIALAVDLPTNNETKFAFPLYLVLSALAVGGFDRWMDGGTRRRLNGIVIYVALCTVPLNTVYFYGAFRDRSQFVVTPSELSIYEWIRKMTRDEAMFLEADDIVRIPVLASRDQYWGTEAYAHNWAYPENEMIPRRALRDAVFGDGEMADTEFEHAALLERPFYVVLRNIHVDEGRRFKRLSDHPRFTGKYMTQSIAVFEVNLKPR
jgi:hypothetical protein